LRSTAQLHIADKEVAVPSFRRRASVIDADRVEEPTRDPDTSADAADALSLAEEAEAEAAEAEAIAAAARARARAIRLRRQAQAANGGLVADTSHNGTETADLDSEVADAEASDLAAEPVETSHDIEAGPDADDIATDEADSPAEDEPVRNRRRRRLGRVLKVLVSAVAIACIAALITLSVLMMVSHRHQAAEERSRAEYAAAARQSVITLMSLDFNKAKDDVQRIIDNSTGSFKDDFNSQAEDFVKVAQDSKVITEVTVNATAVESMTKDSAVALVSATSRVTNAAGAKQEPRSWRLSVDLQRDGGQIKMSKVEFVP
jgi:Mce-associated membrane protein